MRLAATPGRSVCSLSWQYATRKSRVKETVVKVAALLMVAALPVWAEAQTNANQSTASTRRAEAAVAHEASTDSEWTYWTGGRYRITPGDVLDLTFPFVPELNQTVTVQADGYISLREIDDMRVQGRTLAQIKADVTGAYERFV